MSERRMVVGGSALTWGGGVLIGRLGRGEGNKEGARRKETEREREPRCDARLFGQTARIAFQPPP